MLLLQLASFFGRLPQGFCHESKIGTTCNLVGVKARSQKVSTCGFIITEKFIARLYLALEMKQDVAQYFQSQVHSAAYSKGLTTRIRICI